MEAVLSQLNAVPGVVGSMVCDEDGRVLARAFPPLFDEGMLSGAAKALTDGTAGLETVTGKVHGVDLRYGDARVLVRSLAGGHLLLLCAAQINQQMLNISTSVAVPKLEKLVASPPPLPPPPAAPAVAAAPADKKAAKAPAKKEKKSEPPPEDPGLFHW